MDKPLTSPGRGLAIGATVWAAYSLVQVLVNGIVLDETIVPAQIITSSVQYPPGHPHVLYYKEAFSLGNFFSAALWLLSPNAGLISAFRNWLFLVLSTFTPFALALILTRRLLWAHVAAVLCLLEVHLRFQGVYPIWVFPIFYSNGHIGLQIALLIVALLLARMWRAGGILAGLLPAIHGTMAIMVWPWIGFYALFSKVAGHRGNRKALASWAGFGLAISVALALIIALLSPSEQAAAAYHVEADGQLILRNFRLITDGHRQPFRVHSFAYLMNPIALFVLGFLLWWQRRHIEAGRQPADARQVLWLLAFGAIIWTFIYVTRALQAVGVTLPDFLLTTMPGRFSNLSAVLLPPLTVAVVAASLEAFQPKSRPLAEGLFASLLIVSGIAALNLFDGVSRDLVARNLLFLTWGLAIAFTISAARTRQTKLLVPVAAGALIGMTLASFIHYTYVAVYFAGTCLAVIALIELRRFLPGWIRLVRLEAYLVVRGLLLLGLLIASIAALPDRMRDEVDPAKPRWDVVNEDDHRLRRWLETNAKADELIATAYYHWRAETQAKTGYPVLIELETLHLMSYMPSLAPVVGSLVRDIYGIDYQNSAALRRYCPNRRLNVWCPIWREIWAERSRDEWVDLSRKYDFRLVLAPTGTSLDLPRVLQGPVWTLYLIDRAFGTPAPRNEAARPI